MITLTKGSKYSLVAILGLFGCASYGAPSPGLAGCVRGLFSKQTPEPGVESWAPPVELAPPPSVPFRNRNEAAIYLKQVDDVPIRNFFSFLKARILPADSKLPALPSSQELYEFEVSRLKQYLGTARQARTLIGEPSTPGAFNDWLKENELKIFSRESLKAYAAKKYTFQQFRQELEAEFYVQEGLAPLKKHEQVLGYISGNPVLRNLMHGLAAQTIGFSRETKAVLKGALIAGPVAGSVGAFLATLVDPLVNTLRKVGTPILSGPSRYEQDFLNQFAALAARMNPAQADKATAARDTLKGLLAHLRESKNLSPKQREDAFKKMEPIYYDTIIRMQSALAGNLRDGRDIYMDKNLRTPLDLASKASTFFNEGIGIENHMAILRLNPAAAQDPKTQALLERDAQRLKDSRRRLAAAMVGWRINEINYREYTEIKDADGKLLNDDYSKFRDWLGFEPYASEVEDEMSVLIDQLDLYLDKYQGTAKKK